MSWILLGQALGLLCFFTQVTTGRSLLYLSPVSLLLLIPCLLLILSSTSSPLYFLLYQPLKSMDPNNVPISPSQLLDSLGIYFPLQNWSNASPYPYLTSLPVLILLTRIQINSTRSLVAFPPTVLEAEGAGVVRSLTERVWSGPIKPALPFSRVSPQGTMWSVQQAPWAPGRRNHVLNYFPHLYTIQVPLEHCKYSNRKYMADFLKKQQNNLRCVNSSAAT